MHNGKHLSIQILVNIADDTKLDINRCIRSEPNAEELNTDVNDENDGEKRCECIYFYIPSVFGHTTVGLCVMCVCVGFASCHTPILFDNTNIRFNDFAR